MHNLTPEGQTQIEEIARRHAVSVDAAMVLLEALVQGNGYQAQFSHPELGGMGQWSQGGMIMVGDMFNQGLKYRVDELCNEIAALVRNQPSVLATTPVSQSQNQGSFGKENTGASFFAAGTGSSGQWWPAELNNPSSTGAQNDMRYAYFPDRNRLAIQQGGLVRVYDTGNHSLYGFSQQQSGDRSLTFTSQFGLVRVADLHLIPSAGGKDEAEDRAAPVAQAPFAPAQSPPFASTPGPPQPAEPLTVAVAAPSTSETILKMIEGLAGLREKGVLTEDEFAAKKTELLSRL